MYTEYKLSWIVSLVVLFDQFKIVCDTWRESKKAQQNPSVWAAWELELSRDPKCGRLLKGGSMERFSS